MGKDNALKISFLFLHNTGGSVALAMVLPAGVSARNAQERQALQLDVPSKTPEEWK